jgi:hypothetical protein
MKKRVSGILFCVVALSSSLSYAAIPSVNSHILIQRLTLV